MKKLFYRLFSFTVLGLLGFSSVLSLANAQFNNQNTSYNPGVPGADQLKNDSLITSVKTFINRVLGILALITLVILLRGGFQMVTAAGDDGKYKNGFKILKQAGFGLAFIGLSRLVVSMIFRLITLVAGN